MSLFGWIYLVLSLLLLADVPALHANSTPRHPWFFTAEEIETAYRYQEKFGKGLAYPLQARNCQLGAEEMIASYYGEPFVLPCRFVTETVRHLKEMLKAGAARYFFPLDSDHAHFAIPDELWEKKYRKYPGGKVIPALIQDPNLVALYHTAEHLTIVDPATGEINEGAIEWKEKRNVLGFYDGSPINILPPHPRGFGLSVPEPYRSYGGFHFLANPGGQLAVIFGNDAIAVDITLNISDTRVNQLQLKRLMRSSDKQPSSHP